VPHLPNQPRNETSELWSEANPSPRKVLFNRYVNLAAHETAHGFGLMSSRLFFRHGSLPTPAQLYAIGVSKWAFLQGVYVEEDATTDLLHEPIRIFGAADESSNFLLMQAVPFRWVNKYPFANDSYDTPNPPAVPSKWLVFDRLLRFSTGADYARIGRPDRSLSMFFHERVPLCVVEAGRSCR
jgi:hypothetical protein